MKDFQSSTEARFGNGANFSTAESFASKSRGSEKEALRCWRHGAQTFSQTPITRHWQLAVQARDQK